MTSIGSVSASHRTRTHTHTLAISSKNLICLNATKRPLSVTSKLVLKIYASWCVVKNLTLIFSPRFYLLCILLFHSCAVITSSVPSDTFPVAIVTKSVHFNTFLNVNKNPTRCNSMQIFIYWKVTLHVSGVTAPIIRSTKNCNRSLRFPPTRTGHVGGNRKLWLHFLVLLMMGAVTPEACRVTLQ